ncbi:hypothetical protein D9M70_446070 [compost metagenome]
MGQHGFLVGNGHHQPGQIAHRRQSGDEPGEVFRTHMEGHEHGVAVQALHIGVEALRCAHVVDGVGDDADEAGFSVDHAFLAHKRR